MKGSRFAGYLFSSEKCQAEAKSTNFLFLQESRRVLHRITGNTGWRGACMHMAAGAAWLAVEFKKKE